MAGIRRYIETIPYIIRVRINEKIMHRENSKKKVHSKKKIQKKNAREHRIIVYMSRRAHGLAMRGTIPVNPKHWR